MAMTTSRVLCVVAVLLVVLVVRNAEAATIETFNGASCAGNPTNTYRGVRGNSCQTFIDQGAVRITGISAGTRVSVHNQRNCQTGSSVAQIYGPGCVVQGRTKLRAVYISA